MPTLDDVATILAELPGAVANESDGRRSWTVAGKGIVWERAFSKADLRRFGDEPVPDGPILAVRVADLVEKEAVLAAHEAGVFTIPHFNGYAAVLVQLPIVEPDTLRELLVEAWRTYAPGAPPPGG